MLEQVRWGRTRVVEIVGGLGWRQSVYGEMVKDEWSRNNVRKDRTVI